jgi:hypothetical protein
MSAPTWTEEEFRRFDRLTWQLGSRDQLDRIGARLKLRKWEQTDKPKLDAMFAEIKRRDAEKKNGRRTKL